VAARLQVALDFGVAGSQHIARFGKMSRKAVYEHRGGRDTGSDAAGTVASGIARSED